MLRVNGGIPAAPRLRRESLTLVDPSAEILTSAPLHAVRRRAASSPDASGSGSSVTSRTAPVSRDSSRRHTGRADVEERRGCSTSSLPLPPSCLRASVPSCLLLHLTNSARLRSVAALQFLKEALRTGVPWVQRQGPFDRVQRSRSISRGCET